MISIHRARAAGRELKCFTILLFCSHYAVWSFLTKLGQQQLKWKTSCCATRALAVCILYLLDMFKIGRKSMFLSLILSTYQNTKYHNKHMVKICSFGIRRKILGNRKHNLLIQIQKNNQTKNVLIFIIILLYMASIVVYVITLMQPWKC